MAVLAISSTSTALVVGVLVLMKPWLARTDHGSGTSLPRFYGLMVALVSAVCAPHVAHQWPASWRRLVLLKYVCLSDRMAAARSVACDVSQGTIWDTQLGRHRAVGVASVSCG